MQGPPPRLPVVSGQCSVASRQVPLLPTGHCPLATHLQCSVRRSAPVIARYTRPEMGLIWDEENKFRQWLAVELAATETLAEAGLVPRSAARAIRLKADFELERIKAIEAEVKHDVIAFTTAVAEKVGPESRWLHYGLTSNDVVDTAQALLVKQASAILHADLEKLIEVLKRRAIEFQHTPQIGRTHGIHAEPITFGLKLANWYSEMRRNLERFTMAAEQMRVGKLWGAGGNAAHLEPEYEEKICERLGLNVAAVSSQVIQRDPAQTQSGDAGTDQRPGAGGAVERAGGI